MYEVHTTSAGVQSLDNYWRTSAIERQWREILVADLQRHFAGPCSFLDVGCGTGVIYEALVEAGLTTPEQYTGVDASEAMLHVARERYPEASWEQADIAQLPFRSLQHSNVLCISVLQHLPDYRQALRELLRVTRTQLYVTMLLCEGSQDESYTDEWGGGVRYPIEQVTSLLASGQAELEHLFRQNYAVVFRRRVQRRAAKSEEPEESREPDQQED